MEVLPISSNNIDYNSSEEWSYDSYPSSTEDISECTQAVSDLACRLEEELKLAKHHHFASGEVLLPYDLLQHIARDIMDESETEPCGLRGCTLYVRFENGNTAARTKSADQNTVLAVVELDRYTPSTFELFLTLKRASTGWNSFIPQFLKKYIRRGDVMIDTQYTLEKNKLYRSYIE